MGKLKKLGRQLFSLVSSLFVRVTFLGKILEVFYQEYSFSKIVYTQQRIHQKLRTVFYKTEVKYGHFQGMKYPELEGVGSELFPKLLGCYELELNDWLNRIQHNEYDKIVNVGCAEGYYAVGLARMFPAAKVYAYDLAERARVLCREMGQINGVGDRLQIFSKCTDNTLKKLDFGKRSLIVCDCEGFEMELFKEAVMENIANCDVLIELHDFINPEISDTMLPRFEETHNLQIYRSMDDELKMIQLGEKYQELQFLTAYEQKIALGELRPTTMEWAFLTPKKAISKKAPLRVKVAV
ncbi:MAG: hypothetical protein AAGJ18_16660 [Bacteroidota bacterium]